MDEMKVAKGALKIEYLKETASKMAENLKVYPEDIAVDEKGNIVFSIEPNTMAKLARELMNELAETKTELWFQKQSTAKE